MMVKRMKSLTAAAAAISLLGLGCDAAKDVVQDAAEEAAGLETLETTDIETLKTDAGWDDTKLPGFKIHAGIKITEDSVIDMGETTQTIEIPVGDLPAGGEEAAQGQLRSMLIIKSNKFKMGENEFTRFEIVTIGKFEGGKIVIDGAKFTEFMDADQRVGKANGNNAGTYLVAEGKGSLGLMYITGDTKLLMNDGTTKKEVKGAIVFSDKSPFLAKTGSSGKFLLALPDGQMGKLMAYRKNIAGDYAAAGTPESASADILTKGLLDDYKDDVTGKASELGADGGKVGNDFDKLNTAVTDFLDGWKMMEMPLQFSQPPAAVEPPAAADTPPAEATPADPDPEDTTIIRKEAATDPQIDLGCTGKKDAADTKFNTIVRDGSKFDDYSANPGWRCSGDCRISREFHSAIFGAPDTVGGDNATRYPDKSEGYCLLTTGDNLYKLGNSEQAGLQPGPADGTSYKGQQSEMWQQVKVPNDAKSIQLRVAFFSQEFPRWVGSGFNDSFFVKFDESPDFIGKGSLNDLAGMGSTGTEAEKTAAKDCKNNKSIASTSQVKCGQWQSVAGDDNLTHGAIWNIDKSSHAVSQGTSFGCSNGAENNCYHGWVPPKVLCKPIKAEQAGKTLTLRMSISDAGDKYYDSAIAVDSVVFSKDDCNTRFTGEDASRAITE